MVSSVARARLFCGLACRAGRYERRRRVGAELVQVDIPSQALSDSLLALGRQTGTNIIYDPSIVKRRARGCGTGGADRRG